MSNDTLDPNFDRVGSALNHLNEGIRRLEEEKFNVQNVLHYFKSARFFLWREQEYDEDPQRHIDRRFIATEVVGALLGGVKYRHSSDELIARRAVEIADAVLEQLEEE